MPARQVWPPGAAAVIPSPLCVPSVCGLLLLPPRLHRRSAAPLEVRSFPVPKSSRAQDEPSSSFSSPPFPSMHARTQASGSSGLKIDPRRPQGSKQTQKQKRATSRSSSDSEGGPGFFSGGGGER